MSQHKEAVSRAMHAHLVAPSSEAPALSCSALSHSHVHGPGLVVRLDQANCLVREDVRVVRAVEIEGRGTGIQSGAVAQIHVGPLLVALPGIPVIPVVREAGRIIAQELAVVERESDVLHTSHPLDPPCRSLSRSASRIW